jgi:uncharacterized protein YukE
MAMGQYTHVDPEALSANSVRFNEAGADALRLAQDLHSGLASIGNCWGDDEIGKAFIQNYGPQSGSLEEGTRGLYEMMHGIGESLQAMAQAYGDAEAEAQAAANQVA